MTRSRYSTVFRRRLLTLFPFLRSRVGRGLVWALVAMVFFAWMNVTIKFITREVDPTQAVFFRNFVSLVVLFPFAMRGGFRILRTERMSAHLFRAILGFVSMECWFIALAHTKLAEALILSYAKPFFSILIGVFMLGEIVRIRRWSATILGFIGVLIVLEPSKHINPYAFFALLSAFFSTCIAVMVKSLSKTESPQTVVTYLMVFLTPLSLIPALFVWKTPSLEMMGLIVVMGLLSTMAQLCFTRALRDCDISLLGPLEFVKLPMVAFLGWVFFAESVSVGTWIGGGLILLSALYIAHREVYLKKKPLVVRDQVG